MTHEYTDEHGQRVLVLTRNEAIDRQSIIEMMRSLRTCAGRLRRGLRALVPISARTAGARVRRRIRKAHGPNVGRLAYLVELASEYRAGVDRSAVSNWKAGPGAEIR